MLLINGSKQHCINVTDRGFQYGDGLFETIEIHHAQAVFLQQHLERMQAGCIRLAIPYPGDRLLMAEIDQLIGDTTHAILKIILSRGIGDRGYRQPEQIQVTRVLSINPFPHYPSEYFQTGIRARFCDFRLGLNPGLSGIKHLNRLEQVMARSEWQQADIQEGLMMDINDNVIEGTMSNVFIVSKQNIFTPRLDDCGVEGIIRQIILNLAQVSGLVIIVKKISRAEVLDADEVFVTNSVIGIWPVKMLGDRKYSANIMTKKIQLLLEKFKQKGAKDVL